MIFFGIIASLTILGIFALLIFLFYKVFIKRKIPNNYYTPFDYIIGHTKTEFHEEQQVQVQEDEKGDDKNKGARQ